MQDFIEYCGSSVEGEKVWCGYGFLRDKLLQYAHRLRLEKYKRDLHSLQKERKNLQAVWSPEGKLITIHEC
ncbi:WD40-like protein [Arachis hypogaea]|nr:WD40-like protein [Arachis hypogaea]